MSIRDHGSEFEDIDRLAALTDSLLAKNGLPGESISMAMHAATTGMANTTQTPAENTMSKARLKAK